MNQRVNREISSAYRFRNKHGKEVEVTESMAAKLMGKMEYLGTANGSMEPPRRMRRNADGSFREETMKRGINSGEERPKDEVIKEILEG